MIPAEISEVLESIQQPDHGAVRDLTYAGPLGERAVIDYETKRVGDVVIVKKRILNEGGEETHSYAIWQGSVLGFKLEQIQPWPPPPSKFWAIKVALFEEATTQFGVYRHDDQPKNVLLGIGAVHSDASIYDLDELKLLHKAFYHERFEGKVPLGGLYADNNLRYLYFIGLTRGVIGFGYGKTISGEPLPYTIDGTTYDLRLENEQAVFTAAGDRHEELRFPRAFSEDEIKRLEDCLKTDTEWLTLPRNGLHGKPLMTYFAKELAR